MSIVSLSTLRERMSLTPEKEARVATAIAASIRIFENMTRRKLVRVEDWETTYDIGDGQYERIYIPHIVKGLTLTEFEINDESPEPLDDADVMILHADVFERDTIVHRRGARFWKRFVKIEASNAGPEEKDVPIDIVEALTNMTIFLVERHTSDKIIMASQSFGDSQTNYLPPDFTKLFLNIATAYRSVGSTLG